MAWIRGLCPQSLHIVWCRFGLPPLWQYRDCLHLSLHQSCSKTSSKTSLGQQWSKYLTCPAPERAAALPAGAPAAGQQCQLGESPAAESCRGMSGPWGRLRLGAHAGMPREGSSGLTCPGALSQKAWGARLLGHPHWEWAAGGGSCTPLSWHQCPQCAWHLGLAGSPSWQPPSPCSEAPALAVRQVQAGPSAPSAWPR